MVPRLQDAINYQQSCVTKGQPCPIIVCLDGNRVESSSFSDPDACLKPHNEIPFVFGALPAERTREWGAANRAAEACSELCTQLEEKQRLDDKGLVASTEKEIQAKKQHVTSLEAQLSTTARVAMSGDSRAPHSKRRASLGDDEAVTKRPRGLASDANCWT